MLYRIIEQSPASFDELSKIVDDDKRKLRIVLSGFRVKVAQE